MTRPADDPAFLATLSPMERKFFGVLETEPALDSPRGISDRDPGNAPKGLFATKDSGTREDLAGGMVRDSETGKTDYTLAFDGPLFVRWCELLTRGAIKYQPRNWMKALLSRIKPDREKTKERFKRSATRHFMQWLRGDRDEDHAAAVVFNLNGYEAMLDTDPKEAQ